MSEAEEIEKVVSVLRKVPAKPLLLIELANSIPCKNGIINRQELILRAPEIKLAIEEAKIYGSHTLQAVDALVRIKAVNG